MRLPRTHTMCDALNTILQILQRFSCMSFQIIYCAAVTASPHSKRHAGCSRCSCNLTCPWCIAHSGAL